MRNEKKTVCQKPGQKTGQYPLSLDSISAVELVELNVYLLYERNQNRAHEFVVPPFPRKNNRIFAFSSGEV